MAEQVRFNNFGQLDIGYQLKSGWFVETGLMYREKHEQLNWSQTIATDVSEFENQRAFYSTDQLGDTTFYSGRSERVEITKREVKHWNKLKTYEIPVTLGYHQYFNKLSLRGALGVVLNVSTNFSGRIVDLDQQIVDNPEITLNSQLAYQTSLGMAYEVFDRHQLFVNASYYYSPKFEILAVEQDYQSLNMALGVRLFLTRPPLLQLSLARLSSTHGRL